MRIPNGAALDFSREQLQWPKRYKCDEELQRTTLCQWLRRIGSSVCTKASIKRLHGDRSKPDWRRARNRGAGALCRMQCVRQSLYDWFVGLRYSIEWKSVDKSNKRSCLGRYVSRLVRQKAQSLVADNVREHLLQGKRARVVKLRSRWFAHWRADYGLSMRKPNRKYKVPKAVMAVRLEIGWLNGARVRAFCVATHGYDPEFENWDQSPFHIDESRSANSSTLAVAGTNVPLIEGLYSRVESLVFS